MKVKYTRNEYRKEYLNSDEWKNLRDQVIASKPNCQCCHKFLAHDVHHLVYRNLVDVKVSDILPVCRSCHNLIHRAINDGFISQREDQVDAIREQTINILNNQEYKNFCLWAKQKHFLQEEELKLLHDDRVTSWAIRRISGLVKRKLDYDTVKEVKFTGRQIIKIRKILETSLWRRNHSKKLRKGIKWRRATNYQDEPRPRKRKNKKS